MSELVDRRMELMAEEIEQMKRLNLYNEQEIDQILKKRRDFERKIASVTKVLQDYRDYILYEKVLFKQIRLRRNKNKIAEKRNAIDYKIIKRIKNLYEMALQRFSNDFSLHCDYFKFCKQSNFGNTATEAIQNMIKNCSYNPETWKIASTFYAENQNDINKALELLHKGLALHKDCKMLYIEVIQRELSKLKNVSKKELESEQKDCSKKIIAYVNFFCESINDFNDLLELLKYLEAHSFTESSQNALVEKLQKDHSQEPLLWHHLAQREKRGLHYGLDKGVKKSTKLCLSNCFAKYKEGILKVPPAKKQILWFLYLDCLIEENENSGVANVTKRDALKAALEESSKENVLTESYYIKWLHFLTDAEALVVLEKGTNCLPNSVELWKLRLRYATMTDSISQVKLVFDLGVVALKEKSLPLWLIMIRFLSLISKHDDLEGVFEKGIQESTEIAHALKPKYIEWLGMFNGIEKAREMYNKLAPEKPYCKELHKMMARIESTEIKYDMKAFVSVYKFACEQFGLEDTDVWMDYVMFYIRFDPDESKREEIYQKAKTTLSPSLVCEFEEKFDKAIKAHETQMEQ